MRILSIVMGFILIISCEQSMDIQDRNETPIEHIDHSKNIANGLNLFEGSGDSDGLEEKAPGIDGLDVEKHVWLSVGKGLFAVAISDQIAPDYTQSASYGNFGEIKFSNTSLERHEYAVYHEYQLNFTGSLDLPNYDENDKMSFEIKAAPDYEDTFYEMKESMNDVYENVIEITNFDMENNTNHYSFNDDFVVQLSEKMTYKKSYISLGFSVTTEQSYTIDGVTYNETSGRIYLEPTKEQKEYVIEKETMLELVRKSVDKFESLLLRRFRIQRDFKKGKINHIQYGVRKYDVDYDKLPVTRSGDFSSYDIQIVLLKGEHMLIRTDDFDIDL